MLVLARKTGEKLCLGNGVIISVLRIRRGRVRIGIEAPADVCVARTELARQHRPSKTRQAQPAPSAHTGDGLAEGDRYFDRPA